MPLIPVEHPEKIESDGITGGGIRAFVIFDGLDVVDLPSTTYTRLFWSATSSDPDSTLSTISPVARGSFTLSSGLIVYGDLLEVVIMAGDFSSARLNTFREVLLSVANAPTTLVDLLHPQLRSYAYVEEEFG